jgi:hypothetical protein
MAVPKYVADLQVGQAAILGEVKALNGRLDEYNKNVSKNDSDKEKRLRSLEKSKHWYAGVAAGMGAVFGTLVEIVTGPHH